MSDKAHFISSDVTFDTERLAEKNVKILINQYLDSRKILDVSVRTIGDIRTAQVLRSRRIVIKGDYDDSQMTTRVSYGVAKMEIRCITAKALDVSGEDVLTLLGLVRSSFIGEIPEETLSRDGIVVYPNSMRFRGSFEVTDVEEENKRVLLIDIPMYRE